MLVSDWKDLDSDLSGTVYFETFATLAGGFCLYALFFEGRVIPLLTLKL